MAKVIQFPDHAGKQATYNARVQLIADCQTQVEAAIRAMSAAGADTSQIIRILRHAITELDLDRPS
jgi:hypothetical protein